MKVLLGFEESQAVTNALRSKGVEAYSCDIKPCSGGHPEHHLQMNILDALNLHKWYFIGIHPVCTKMGVSGNWVYAKGKPKERERLEAIEQTISLWLTVCKKSKSVYMENPIGALNSDRRLPRPQIVQPYNFKEDASKATCLWLKNLEPLTSTGYIEPRIVNGKKRWSNQTDSGQNKLWTSKNRAELRSKTFPGIASAMAEQWGRLL